MKSYIQVTSSNLVSPTIFVCMKRSSLEFQTVFMRDILNYDKTLAKTAAFIRWASENDGAFLV